MLEIEKLSFSYKGGPDLLKDISFKLEREDIMCILGPNGTGKTSLLKSMLGLNKIDSGRVLLEGQDLGKMKFQERAKKIAYVAQSTSMTFSYKVEEVVLMGRVAHLAPGRSPSKEDRMVVDWALDKLSIKKLEGKLFHQLSGGERQMVLVARALAQQSSILIMDEPTANLDFSNQIKILKAIKSLSREGYAILMTSHFPDHSFLACNKAVLMKEGYIIDSGHPKEVVTSKSLTELYGTEICVSDVEIYPEGKKTKVCIPLLDS